MRRLSPVFWVGLVLAGCVSPAPYGYLVKGGALAQMPERLAHDTVMRMESLYPPAHTRLALTHPATDPYGVGLIDALRRKGYAVMEYRANTRMNPSIRDDMPVIVQPIVSHKEGLPLGYVVDGPFESRLYRVTVFIGAQSLSRAYRMDEQVIAQAGAWVRKE